MDNSETRASLTDLNDAGEFHDWRLPLPICECDRLLVICIRPGKTLAVSIENRGQPMPVLPAFIFSEFRSFAVCVHAGILPCYRTLLIVGFLVRRHDEVQIAKDGGHGQLGKAANTWSFSAVIRRQCPYRMRP